MTVFKTKNGVTLEYNNGKFASDDMEAVKEALWEDYYGDDIIASVMAKNLLSILWMW